MRWLPPTAGMTSVRDVLVALRTAHSSAQGEVGLADRLRARIGCKYWVLTNSGRSALTIVLMALRERRPGRDEVVIPAYTSYSVPAAVVRAGLRVRLCDVEMETLGISPKELERTITARTLCVALSHLYGVPCQIKVVCEVARDHRVPIVEDAAQAMGVRCMSQPVGTLGDVGLFSLSRGKSLPAAGGGLIGTNDQSLARKCEEIVEHAQPSGKGPGRIGFHSAVEATLMSIFIRPSLYWLPASLSFLKLGASIYDPNFQIAPMSRFQETLAARLLSGLGELQAIRVRNAVRLGQAMAEFKGIWVIWPKEGETGGFLRLPILLRDLAARDRVLTELKQQGLGATRGYPSPLSEIPDLRPRLMSPDEEYPVARQISEQLVTLPTHPWVRERDIQKIVEVVRQCIQ